MFERQSALASTLASSGCDRADGTSRLRIGEVRGWNLVQIAAFATTLTDLESAVWPVLNADLPKSIGEVVSVEGRHLVKTGPEQYWIFTAGGDEYSRKLEAAVAPGIGAVTPLSHSRTCISIEGADAREVLMKGIALDLHPEVFALNRFALTGLHHTPILIHRSGEMRYELYAMRTFALSVWEWLTDAALPLGDHVIGSAEPRSS